MFITNSKLNLFLLENPEFKEMILYLAESPKNVFSCLDYSNFLYDNADGLLISALIEIHGDKIIPSLYDAFKNMEDEFIESLENAPLNSINFIPDNLINPRILTLYANKGLIHGFDKIVEDENELLSYYRLAAKNIEFYRTNEFFQIWDKEDDISRDILTKRFFENSYCNYNKQIWSTLVEYFKDNYEDFSDIKPSEVLEIVNRELRDGRQIDTIEYYNIIISLNQIDLSSSMWMLKRLFKERYMKLFEKLVLKINWYNENLDLYSNTKVIKKIKKIIKKKYH